MSIAGPSATRRMREDRCGTTGSIRSVDDIELMNLANKDSYQTGLAGTCSRGKFFPEEFLRSTIRIVRLDKFNDHKKRRRQKVEVLKLDVKH